MGLDTYFYSKNKIEIGYFRKTYFLLNYFNITINDNLKNIKISKETFVDFVEELNSELSKHKFPCDDIPVNKKFFNCQFLITNDPVYDENYWKSLYNVFIWAKNTLISFDWDQDELTINSWW